MIIILSTNTYTNCCVMTTGGIIIHLICHLHPTSIHLPCSSPPWPPISWHSTDPKFSLESSSAIPWGTPSRWTMPSAGRAVCRTPSAGCRPESRSARPAPRPCAGLRIALIRRGRAQHAAVDPPGVSLVRAHPTVGGTSPR